MGGMIFFNNIANVIKLKCKLHLTHSFVKITFNFISVFYHGLSYRDHPVVERTVCIVLSELCHVPEPLQIPPDLREVVELCRAGGKASFGGKFPFSLRVSIWKRAAGAPSPMILHSSNSTAPSSFVARVNVNTHSKIVHYGHLTNTATSLLRLVS